MVLRINGIHIQPLLKPDRFRIRFPETLFHVVTALIAVVHRRQILAAAIPLIRRFDPRKFQFEKPIFAVIITHRHRRRTLPSLSAPRTNPLPQPPQSSEPRSPNHHELALPPPKQLGLLNRRKRKQARIIQLPILHQNSSPVVAMMIFLQLPLQMHPPKVITRIDVKPPDEQDQIRPLQKHRDRFPLLRLRIQHHRPVPIPTPIPQNGRSIRRIRILHPQKIRLRKQIQIGPRLDLPRPPQDQGGIVGHSLSVSHSFDLSEGEGLRGLGGGFQ
mmetsp:Transcript_13052/g.25586  ORF Transcript_13052/g.25586 Transcript_13052/m.25586 type:complete len:273 (+) Transcript_13052:666-1484(+)